MKQITERIEKYSQKIIEKKDASIKNFIETRDNSLKKVRGQMSEISNKIRTMKVSAKKTIFSQEKIRYIGGLILSIPFIYSMIIPALVLHIFLEVYHQVCFRLYRIDRVEAKKYFTTDRDLLPYLSFIEKINCFYCSYFNGLVAYTSEIAGRTEKFFCPIKHARKRPGTHAHYQDFAEFGNKQDFMKKKEKKKCFR